MLYLPTGLPSDVFMVMNNNLFILYFVPDFCIDSLFVLSRRKNLFVIVIDKVSGQSVFLTLILFFFQEFFSATFEQKMMKSSSKIWAGIFSKT